MKVNNIRGGLTDVSAKKEALLQQKQLSIHTARGAFWMLYLENHGSSTI